MWSWLLERNYWLHVWVLTIDICRYAYIEYGSQQEVDDALPAGNELEMEGTKVVCLNYGELNEAINRDMDEPLSDIGERRVINNLK